MSNKFKDIGVVIPVRMHSSRVEKKVLLTLNDEDNIEYSLLSWKINQLSQIINPEQIFISTESDVFKEIAESLGCKTLHRSDYLTYGHQATTRESIEGVIKDIPYEHIAWVTAVVPLMQPHEYKHAFNNYLEFVVNQKKYDSLVTVNLLKEYFWNDNGPINYEANENHPDSQFLPNIYRVTNGLYMAKKETMMDCGYFLGKNPYKEVVSKISGIDIDEYEDYEMAKSMLNVYFKRLKNAYSD